MSLSETLRLSEMLRNMLSFSKPQEEQRREIDINRFLEDILLFLEKQLKEATIKIKTNFDLPSGQQVNVRLSSRRSLIARFYYLFWTTPSRKFSGSFD